MGVGADGGLSGQANYALERRPVGLEAGDDGQGPYSEIRRPAEDLHCAGAARAGTDDDVAPAVTVEIADGDARSASGHSGAERREALDESVAVPVEDLQGRRHASAADRHDVGIAVVVDVADRDADAALERRREGIERRAEQGMRGQHVLTVE